jgi:hypothetical protein
MLVIVTTPDKKLIKFATKYVGMNQKNNLIFSGKIAYGSRYKAKLLRCKLLSTKETHKMGLTRYIVRPTKGYMIDIHDKDIDYKERVVGKDTNEYENETDTIVEEL